MTLPSDLPELHEAEAFAWIRNAYRGEGPYTIYNMAAAFAAGRATTRAALAPAVESPNGPHYAPKCMESFLAGIRHRQWQHEQEAPTPHPDSAGQGGGG